MERADAAMGRGRERLHSRRLTRTSRPPSNQRSPVRAVTLHELIDADREAVLALRVAAEQSPDPPRLRHLSSQVGCRARFPLSSRYCDDDQREDDEDPAGEEDATVS